MRPIYLCGGVVAQLQLLFLFVGCGADLLVQPSRDAGPAPSVKTDAAKADAADKGNQRRDTSQADPPPKAPVEKPVPGAGVAPVKAENVDLFDGKRLHRIDVVLDSGELPRGEDERTSATVSIDGAKFAAAGVRGKGNGSYSYAKPSMSIKLDEFVSGHRYGGLDKFVVNNCVQDGGFLNEAVGYDYFRRAGLPAPRTSHAVVSLNGKSAGIYLIKEAIDGDFLKRVFGAGNSHGNLYEARLTDFASFSYGMELKHEKEEMRSRADIESAAKAANSPADTLWEATSAVIDMDRFVLGMAIDAVVADYDDYMYSSNNYYMYRDPKLQRFVFIPHGMDMLFAKPRDIGGDPVFDLDPLVRIDGNGWGPPGRLAVALRSTPALETKFKRAVVDAIALWDVDTLQALADQVATVLHTADATQPRIKEDLAAFDRRLALWKTFIVKRRQYLDQVVAKIGP